MTHAMNVTRFFRWAGPAAAAAAYLAASACGMDFAFSATLALTALCALWWMSEAVDPAFTALLALGLLPVLGILDAKQVAQSVGNELILLLMGAFEKSFSFSRLTVYCLFYPG